MNLLARSSNDNVGSIDELQDVFTSTVLRDTEFTLDFRHLTGDSL
jgi:hypothetical protein